MSKTFVVLDTANTGFYGNRIFDVKHASQFPGAQIWPKLHRAATRRGWAMVTCDVQAETRSGDARIAVISEEVTSFTESLLRQGGIPALLMSGESPNVARRFYFHLRRHAKRYMNVLLFGGFRGRIQPPTRFHTLYWPNEKAPALRKDWNEKRLLVMVASNKHTRSVQEQGPFRAMRTAVVSLKHSGLRMVDPLFRFKDLYAERYKALSFFAEEEGFDLYGRGWDKNSGINRKAWDRIRALNPTAARSKIETLSSYRFSLCFENCVFPGYVTEKIFDCFLGGCIPIYWGAPDIDAYVPSDAYVDMRAFSRWQDLRSFIRQTSARTANNYLDAGESFLTSESFRRFETDTLVAKIVDILEESLHNAS
jgi:hypothetical protein